MLEKQLRFMTLELKSLRARSVRSWITVTGIVVSIAVILTLLTLSSGLQQAVVDTFNDFGTNRIIILSAGAQGGGVTQNTLTDNAVKDVKGISLFETVIPSLTVQAAKIEYRNKVQYFNVMGYDPDQGKDILDAYHIGKYLDQGRFLERGDSYVAVVGSKVAESNPDLADSWSKPIQIHTSISIDDVGFSVVGVLNTTGDSGMDNGVFIPLDAARKISNKTDEVSMIDAIVKPNVQMDDAKLRLERMLNQTIGKDEYVVITPEQILRQFDQIITILQVILVALASISLIVGAVGIMNTMFTSVLEREKEIGIMKSVGSTNGDIMQLFLIEAGLIGLIGGIAGVIVGIGLSYMVGFIAKAAGFNLLKISISLTYVAGCLIFSALIGMISGIVPSYRAARKKIVDTLRDA